jgi:tetratricopeptide (TPR) repeat protein
MSKDKIVLVLLLIIAAASFCGGIFLLEKVEKDGWFQGQSTWLFLNKKFRVLLSENEKKGDQSSSDAQAMRARLLHNVGITCGYTDQWSDALKLLNQSLDFKMKSKSVNPDSLIQSIESLGKAYFLTGNYDNAKTALDFAARDWVRENGEDCKPYARCLSFTGRVHLAMGDHKSAENCFEKARLIFKKEDDRSSTVRVLLLLAESAIARGDYKRAERCINDSIPLLMIDFGDGYSSYFNDEVALLKLLQGQLRIKTSDALDTSQLSEAIRLIEEALSEAEVSFGNDDVYTQKFRLALADAYLSQGDKKGCLEQVQKIEASFEKIGLPKHPFLKSVYETHIKALGSDAKSLSDDLSRRLSGVRYVSTEEAKKAADALGARLNPSPKFLSGRNYSDSWMLPLTFLIVAWAFSGMFACSFACAAVAARKDYGASLWFILGAIFNLFAYLIISALPTRNTITKELGCDFALINDARNGVFLLAMTPLFTILGASIFYYPAPIRDIFVAVFLAFVVCLALFPAIWCFAVAKSKGRKPWLWALIGTLSGIFGLVSLLLLKPGDDVVVDEEEITNTQSEIVMLFVSAVHLGLFLCIVLNIYYSWMLHVEL